MLRVSCCFGWWWLIFLHFNSAGVQPYMCKLEQLKFDFVQSTVEKIAEIRLGPDYCCS